jgi:hypothetical protein
MIIALIGPIDWWWNNNWLSPAHLEYKAWRDDVCKQLVEAGHLVYRPHEAFKGAWDDRMQEVNRLALKNSDIVINLRPAGIPAYGTEEELAYVKELIKYNYAIQILEAPPRDYTQIAHLIVPLADPYSDVHRKSYTK